MHEHRFEPKTPSREDRRVIIGGGPAGLTAAYELSKHSAPAVVLEVDSIIQSLV
jgi:glycine/D-amino acid oxidase-like deaminating enzyme